MQGRTIKVTHPIEPTLFGPFQFHARSLMLMSYSLMWSWCSTYLSVSFPGMIKEHHQSMVAVGAEVEYVEPFEMFSVDEFSVSVDEFKVRQGNSVFQVLHLIRAQGIVVARVKVRWKLLELDGDEALSATPGVIRPALLQKFLPEEVDLSRVERPLLAQLDNLKEHGQLGAEFEYDFTLFRHRCEVADQWVFFELPTLAAESRESLIDALQDDPDELSSSLGLALNTIYMEWRCPFYLFEKGRIKTQAYRLQGKLYFAHHVFNLTRANTLAAIVIEAF